MGKLKLLIVDDHEVVRKGLGFIMQSHPELEIIGEASTAEEAVEKALQLKPDVVVMDVRLNNGSGIDACREIKDRNPDIKIIMLTSFSDDKAIFDSIMAGANGFVLKEIHTDELIKAIQAIGKGESMLDPTITTKVLERMKNAAQEPVGEDALLSLQEKRILALIGEGKTNKEIAQILILSDKTIKNYVSNILSKLNLNNRTEAAAFAIKNNYDQKYLRG